MRIATEQRMDLLNWILSILFYTMQCHAGQKKNKPCYSIYFHGFPHFAPPPFFFFVQVSKRQLNENKTSRKSENEKSNYTAQWFFGFGVWLPVTLTFHHPSPTTTHHPSYPLLWHFAAKNQSIPARRSSTTNPWQLTGASETEAAAEELKLKLATGCFMFRAVARGGIGKSIATGRKVPARDIPAIDGLRVNNVQTAAYPRRTGTQELRSRMVFQWVAVGVEGHLPLIFD